MEFQKDTSMVYVTYISPECLRRVVKLLERDAKNRENVRMSYHSKGLAKKKTTPEPRIEDPLKDIQVVGTMSGSTFQPIKKPTSSFSQIIHPPSQSIQPQYDKGDGCKREGNGKGSLFLGLDRIDNPTTQLTLASDGKEKQENGDGKELLPIPPRNGDGGKHDEGGGKQDGIISRL